jgi:hypothetical protein
VTPIWLFSGVAPEDNPACSITERKVGPIPEEFGGARVKIGASASASLIAATSRAPPLLIPFRAASGSGLRRGRA